MTNEKMNFYAKFVDMLNAGDGEQIQTRILCHINLLHASIGINTENGELQDQLKKAIFYGKPIDYINLIEELGDLLWYIQLMCNTIDITLEDVIETNMRKLKVRYPDKWTEARANNRDLNKERAELEK